MLGLIRGKMILAKYSFKVSSWLCNKLALRFVYFWGNGWTKIGDKKKLFKKIRMYHWEIFLSVILHSIVITYRGEVFSLPSRSYRLEYCNVERNEQMNQSFIVIQYFGGFHSYLFISFINHCQRSQTEHSTI